MRWLALVLCLFASAAHAEDEELYTVLAITTVIDFAQTQQLAHHPEHWKENNPLLGRHPSPARARNAMLAEIALGALVLHFAPEPWQHRALITFTALELGCVGRNFSIGLTGKF